MESVVIYSSKNVKGRRDATGAFIPEAKRFAKINNVPEENMLAVPCVGMKAEKRREIVLDFFDEIGTRRVDMIAWFGHGWSHGIQFGFNKRNIEDLVKALPITEHKHVLYACSTASTNKNTRNIKMPGTDGGFADTLRDTMLNYDFTSGWVDGHLQPGHTTRNPYMIRFMVEEGNTKGGSYIIEPGSGLWSIWVKALKTDFRFKFPFMPVKEIQKYLVESEILLLGIINDTSLEDGEMADFTFNQEIAQKLLKQTAFVQEKITPIDNQTMKLFLNQLELMRS